MVLKLKLILTGAMSPFAIDQTWFTSARFLMRANGSNSVRAAPRALGRIAKVAADERMELVLISIINE